MGCFFKPKATLKRTTIIMSYLKKLGNFWLIILFVSLGGYFCIYNLDFIIVSVPLVGEFKVRAAVAYIMVFLVGCTFTTLFFGINAIKTNFVLSSKNRQIQRLQTKLTELERNRDQSLNRTVEPASTKS